MAVVTLEEAKQYLRVDSADEDGFIFGLLETGESMCADMARMEAGELEGHLPMARIAVLYVTAYLYEHREQADHEELVQTLWRAEALLKRLLKICCGMFKITLDFWGRRRYDCLRDKLVHPPF